MQTKRREVRSQGLALVCGVWFLLTSWAWPYLGNLVFSYPIGLLGLSLWLRIRRANPESVANKWVGARLAAGLVSSIVALVLQR